MKLFYINFRYRFHPADILLFVCWLDDTVNMLRIRGSVAFNVADIFLPRTLSSCRNLTELQISDSDRWKDYK